MRDTLDKIAMIAKNEREKGQDKKKKKTNYVRCMVHQADAKELSNINEVVICDDWIQSSELPKRRNWMLTLWGTCLRPLSFLSLTYVPLYLGNILTMSMISGMLPANKA